MTDSPKRPPPGVIYNIIYIHMMTPGATAGRSAAGLRAPVLSGARGTGCAGLGNLNYTRLYYNIIYYTILYYTIIYYNILYYTIIYYTILERTKWVHPIRIARIRCAILVSKGWVARAPLFDR